MDRKAAVSERPREWLACFNVSFVGGSQGQRVSTIEDSGASICSHDRNIMVLAAEYNWYRNEIAVWIGIYPRKNPYRRR